MYMFAKAFRMHTPDVGPTVEASETIETHPNYGDSLGTSL